MNAEFVEGWKDGVRFGCRTLGNPAYEHLFLMHRFPLVLVDQIVKTAKKKISDRELSVQRQAETETYYRAGFCRGIWFVLNQIDEHDLLFFDDESQKQARQHVADAGDELLRLLEENGR